MVFCDCSILKRVRTALGHDSVRRISAGWEWAQEALRSVEESDQHLAAREGGEEVVFVTLDNGCALVPEVITFEEDVINGVSVTAVWACCIVAGICLKV